MDDARFLAELRRYSDEIPWGEPATTHDLDPEIAALIRYLQALRDVPPPDPTFARRLRESLMGATTISLPLTGPLTSPGRNGRSAPPQRRAVLPPLAVTHGVWSPAQLATALLVLIVLAGSVLAIGSRRPGRLDHAQVFLPALSGTPPMSETVVTETLFDAAVADLPTGPGTAALLRWTLKPSSQALVFRPQEGLRVFAVEAGEITVTEDGTEHQLAAGDVYVAADPDHEVAFSTSGPQDATLFWAYVATRYERPSSDPAARYGEWLIEVFPKALPGGSGRLVAERLTLSPGSALPQEASPLTWTEFFGVGTLGVTLEGDDLPAGWTSGEEQMIHFGATLPAPIWAGTRMVLRNAGDDPLALYRMTLTPVRGEALAGTPVP